VGCLGGFFRVLLGGFFIANPAYQASAVTVHYSPLKKRYNFESESDNFKALQKRA
jgi:hypothetical protein